MRQRAAGITGRESGPNNDVLQLGKQGPQRGSESTRSYNKIAGVATSEFCINVGLRWLLFWEVYAIAGLRWGRARPMATQRCPAPPSVEPPHPRRGQDVFHGCRHSLSWLARSGLGVLPIGMGSTGAEGTDKPTTFAHYVTLIWISPAS